MIMWRCVMATGGRLRYWVSSCFIFIAFHMFFWKLTGGKKPKQTQTFLYPEGAYVQPVHWPSMSPSRDVSVLYSHQMIHAPSPLVAKTLFLPFRAWELRQRGMWVGGMVGLKMWSLEFYYCFFLRPGWNCETVRVKQPYSSWPKPLPLFLKYLCSQIHSSLYFRPLYF